MPEETVVAPPATVVPSKFIKDGKPDVEALAKSYLELEKKQGANAPTNAPAPLTSPTSAAPENKTPETPPVTPTPGAPSFETFEKEYTENGKLKDESYVALEKRYGLPKDTVNDFIKFRQQQAESYAEAVTKTVGGVDNYKKMANWASENLSKEEIDAFDKSIKSGDINVGQMAVAGLKTKYEKANGSDPNIVGGSANPAGKPPFASWDEAVRFRSNPKYNTDVDYQREYRDRLMRAKL